VIVQVTDRHGAQTTAKRLFTVQDQPPTAVISPASIAEPLPLLSNLTFSAAGSSDPDDDARSLTFKWTVTQPGTTSLSACPSPQTPDICWFTATTPGTYHVQFVVKDPSQMESAASVDFVIHDEQPP
jgi:hypothetical protein